MDSSDESFVWEKASCGSVDAEELNSNGDDTEIKIKHENGVLNVEENFKGQKGKKRNLTVDENNVDEIESPRKKKIKTEPESDVDTTRKNKSNISNGYHNDANKLDDDQYLNMRIKQEQEESNQTKSKKVKKHQDNNVQHLDTSTEETVYNVHKKEKKSKKKKKHSKDTTEENIYGNDLCNDEGNNDDTFNAVESNAKSPKKKKSKEKRVSVKFDTPDVTAITSAEESMVLNNYNDLDMSKHKYKNDKHAKMDHASNLEKTTNKSYTEFNSQKLSKKQHQNSMSSETSSIVNSQNDSPNKKTRKEHTVPIFPDKVKPQKNNTGRLLDKIHFEEDVDSDVDITHNNMSQSLNKYLKRNENFQLPSNAIHSSSVITNDDEIWVLKCPHDIDVQKLRDTEFNLDSKSKIKINGESYCGSLDEIKSKITIMTSDHNDFIIKNIVANGTIQFRKRLPKPHVPEDYVMVNNQTDFIPLPETKCRHPLFGSNYKDSINVQVRPVRTNSTSDLALSAATYEKKKKHKKDHSIKPKVEMCTDFKEKGAPKQESDSEVPVKKAKKRKNTNNNESFKKTSKRIKLEPDSAEAWESEKAIEENLFNF